MRVKKKKRSTLQNRYTISMGSNMEIDFDVYVQPKSKKYVLFKDARDVASRLDYRIEELSNLLAECVEHIGDVNLKDKVKREIGWREL